MSVLISTNNKNAMIVIEGSLDIEENIKKFSHDTNEVISNHMPNIIIDFKNVDSIASEGIGKILSLYKSTQLIRATLSFLNIKDDLKDTFNSLIFFKLVNYYDSESKIDF